MLFFDAYVLEKIRVDTHMPKIKENQGFQIKADFAPITVLKVVSPDTSLFEKKLITTVKKAPNFFIGAPVILDISELPNPTSKLITEFCDLLKNSSISPIGIRGIKNGNEKLASDNNLVIMQRKVNKTDENIAQEKKDAVVKSPTKLITKTVRAGSQIYAKGSDLVILASVNPGAECFADGNIHIYGALKGKALAGASGDKDARIFCKTLDAELLAIAGHYQTKEACKKPPENNGMIQIYLENDELNINSI